MHDLAYDAIHDEIVVSSPFAQAILTFEGGAQGQDRPLRVIQGPRTQIVSERGLDKVSIDPVNNEIYVATSLDQILVFPREANGDVAPIRVLGGPDTEFSGRPTMRVDPARNLLLVTGEGGTGRMLIFDRTASGNAKPRAVLNGPAGNQFEVYNGLVITHRVDSIYAWNLNDTGENVRPILRILAPLGAQAETTQQRGIALDPLHKEVIIGTAAGNQVMTFSVPELFDLATNSSQLR
jgi:DNA-binding beta-propeller fold protein YncE